MYHPKTDVPKYEDTQPLPLDKPRTAEEVARKILRENKLDGVEIENHYHSRTFPGPDGADVTTVSKTLQNFRTNHFERTVLIRNKATKNEIVDQIRQYSTKLEK